MRWIAALEPSRVIRPVVHVDTCADSEPGAVDVVVIVERQPQLALQESGPTGRVHDPTGLQFDQRPALPVANTMLGVVVSKVDGLHRDAVDELDTGVPRR